MNNLFNEKNSFSEKNNYSSNSNSSITSSNFLSEVNYNLIGGFQVSSATLDAFNQLKLDTAMYMVDKFCDNTSTMLSFSILDRNGAFTGLIAI